MANAARKDSEEKGSHRLSVSLTPEQHAELSRIAKRHKVSIAWVVREAIESLLRDELPLFRARPPK